MALYEFTVELNDKTYNCKRLVSGHEVKRQTVKVTNIGGKDDPHNYGDSLKPISAMQFNARLIAHEIIKTGR